MSISAHKQIPTAKRIVVKVGSSSITGDNQGNLVKLVSAIASCIARGQEVILVSSGAIATGMPLLNIETKPSDLPTSQALAAVGQSRLMLRYQNVLDSFKVVAGQVLLTAADLESAESSSNAKAAMERMLELGVLPIVNENDTVATNEIRFGDNDRLAALVAVLVQADLLVLFSDIEALYDRPPSEDGAQPIDWVEPLDDLSGIKMGESSSNAKAAMERMLELGVLPIVNENDTVATNEIRFGDNDRLAALVAVLVQADLLVLFSDIEALYDRPPSEDGAQPIDWVEPLDDLSGIKMGESSSKVGTGGAVTKVGAARTATDSGISVLLTSINNAEKALNGERLGTWFQGKELA